MKLRDEYIKIIADRVAISVDDLTEIELKIINASFDIFQDRLSDMGFLSDEIKRLNLEIANLRASLDDKDY